MHLAIHKSVPDVSPHFLLSQADVSIISHLDEVRILFDLP